MKFEIQGEMEKTLVLKDFLLCGWLGFFFFSMSSNTLFAAGDGLEMPVLTNHRMTKVTWPCYLVLMWVELAVVHPF